MVRLKQWLAAMVAAAALALVATAPAEAHRYSWSGGMADARYSVLAVCGASWWACYTRRDPYMLACGDHSWCWSYYGYWTHKERHVTWLWFKNCIVVDGRSEHGNLVSYRESCGDAYA